MSKSENNKNNSEDTIKYVYLPYDDLYGTILQEGLYYSTVEYFDNGVGYVIDVDNEDFVIVEEFGVENIDENEDYL